MDDLQKKNKLEAIWTKDATGILLTTVEELLPQVGKTFDLKTKKKMWSFVAETVLRQHSYKFTALQCQNRWKTLERSRRKKLKSNIGTILDCNYERELDNILNTKVQSLPDFILNGDNDSWSRKHSQETNMSLEARWTEDATKLLLTTVEELLPCVGITFKMKTKKKMWNYVADTLMKQQSYKFTALQCQNRWKTLKRGRNKKMLSSSKPGRCHKKYDYTREFENIICKKETIFPEIVVVHEGEPLLEPYTLKETDLLDRVCNSQLASQALPPDITQMLRTKTRKLTVAGELQQLRQQRSLHHKNLTEIARQKNKAYEERTTEIKRKNDLLEQLIKIMHK